MSKLFRELIGQLSPKRRKSIEARAQTILRDTARHCSKSDALAGLSEQEIDEIVVAEANDHEAWEEPILVTEPSQFCQLPE